MWIIEYMHIIRESARAHIYRKEIFCAIYDYNKRYVPTYVLLSNEKKNILIMWSKMQPPKSSDCLSHNLTIRSIQNWATFSKNFIQQKLSESNVFLGWIGSLKILRFCRNISLRTFTSTLKWQWVHSIFSVLEF